MIRSLKGAILLDGMSILQSPSEADIIRTGRDHFTRNCSPYLCLRGMPGSKRIQ